MTNKTLAMVSSCAGRQGAGWGGAQRGGDLVAVFRSWLGGKFVSVYLSCVILE